MAVLPSQLDEQSMQSASIVTHGVTRYIRAIVVTKFFERQTAAKGEKIENGGVAGFRSRRIIHASYVTAMTKLYAVLRS